MNHALQMTRLAACWALFLATHAEFSIVAQGQETVAEATTAPQTITANRPSVDVPQAPSSRYHRFPADASVDHPLVPVLHVAYRSYQFLRDDVRDYTCRVVTQERIDGQLKPHQFINARVRHEVYNGNRIVRPRAVYLKFLHPKSVAGRELLWIDENNNEMIVRRGGQRFSYLTVTVDPESEAARRDTNYPIGETGLKNLINRLIEKIHRDLKHNESEVEFFRNAKIEDRECYCIQVTHPTQRDHFDFHIARVYVDDEYPIPIRYEAYGFPRSNGEKPPLIESFSFLNLRLNQGFAEGEFTRGYAGYGFD